MISFEEIGLASLFAAYKPSDAENSERMIDISTPIVTEFQNTQAYVIFYECVKELLVKIRCSECGAPMVATPREVGSALIVDFGCSCGGKLRWESQPRIVTRTGKFVGNVLTVASTFLK